MSDAKNPTNSIFEDITGNNRDNAGVRHADHTKEGGIGTFARSLSEISLRGCRMRPESCRLYVQAHERQEIAVNQIIATFQGVFALERRLRPKLP